ncbi:MAG: hypothetical protein WAU56_18130 [Steroidobacteraceae bacterium]
MIAGATTIAGIEVPSTDPFFLAIVAAHVLLGIVAVVSGVAAMLCTKAPGRHPRFGTAYYWSITAIFISATVLSIMRWAEDYHLFILGMLAFAAASWGRTARRRRWSRWASMHILGMSSSYVLLLTAFYVDNGRQLPLWRQLPTWTYWALPALIGAPIIIWALLRHPVVQQALAERIAISKRAREVENSNAPRC